MGQIKNLYLSATSAAISACFLLVIIQYPKVSWLDIQVRYALVPSQHRQSYISWFQLCYA